MSYLVNPRAVGRVREGDHDILEDVCKAPGEDVHGAPAGHLGVRVVCVLGVGAGEHLREGEADGGHVVCTPASDDGQHVRCHR